MPQYLSATIVEDHILYPIHRSNGNVQYAGHILLWDSSETQARTIAAAMCQAPIVGVEIAKQDRRLGAKESRVACIGLSYTEANA